MKRDEAAAELAAETLTDEQIRAKRKALLNELAELPNLDADAAGREPGTEFGDGPAKDKVEYTAAWYQKNFELVEVSTAPADCVVRLNGVGFAVYKGRKCWLPKPHYDVYIDSLNADARLAEKYAPPANPGRHAGYVSPVYRMGDGFIRSAEEPKS
jgi:hypothetical protein